MNFLQKLASKIEYGDYTLIAKYEDIYAEKIDNEKFTLSAKLLQGKTDWTLRLYLNRRWGAANNFGTVIDCHFRTLDVLINPLDQLLRDVDAQVTETDGKFRADGFTKMVLRFAAGKIVRGYGRLDHHLRNNKSYQVELFLSWTGSTYWMVLCEGVGSTELTKLPIGVAESLKGLFPKIARIIGK